MQRMMPAATDQIDELLAFAAELGDDLPGLEALEPLDGLDGLDGLDVATAVTAMKPYSKPDAITSAERDRRERSRLKERRKYYRKKERMDALQAQVKALELELRTSKAAAELAASSLTSAADDQALVVSKPELMSFNREQLQELLTKAMAAKAQVRRENTRLRQTFRQASQHTALLTDLLYAEHKMYMVQERRFRLLRPLSVQACSELHEQTIASVEDFALATATAPVVGAIAGWKQVRVVDGTLFKFTLSKTFYRTTAQYMCLQVWDVLLDPARNRRLYSDELGMSVRLVQKVDDDNYVLLEEMRTMDPDADGVGHIQTVKSALLISRFRTTSGFRIHMRGLDERQVAEDELQIVERVDELWNTSQQLTWLQFDNLGGDGVCSATFAGMTPTIGANVYFWMAEVGLLCLRCENAIVGPRFSVPT